MKKWIIFIVGLVLGFVLFMVLSRWVKTSPAEDKETPTATEPQPEEETPIVEEIEVVEAVDCEKIEDKKANITPEDKNIDPKERNIKWISAKAKIDSKGNVWVDFEGEGYNSMVDIGIEYCLFKADGEYVILKNGYGNTTDYIGNMPNSTSFHVHSRPDKPSSSVNHNDIEKIVGIEIHSIGIKNEWGDEGPFTQTGYQKRFYNIEKI